MSSENTISKDAITINQSTEQALEETILSPRFYTTDFDEMDKINICVEYDEDKPVYKEFEGWLSSTEGVTEYKNLPKNAKKYIEYIEDFIKCSASIISTGPSRDQTISR